MIALNNISFRYGRKKELFSNLSLDLNAGHIYGLLGKNGAGKTTLLKIMAGTLFTRSGQAVAMGFNPAQRKPNFLNQLYFIPEDIYSPDMTTESLIATNAAFYPKFSQQDMAGYLAEFEVDPKAKLTELSFGQRKKAVISFGLATNCPLLIMDEPTNGLDIPAKRQFRKIVASVSNEERCILISTHQVRDLDNLIDTVIVLDNGAISLNRSVDEIAERLAFRQVENSEADGALYGETSLRGTAGIFANTSNEPSKIDMELLFNAMLAEKDKMLNALNK